MLVCFIVYEGYFEHAQTLGAVPWASQVLDRVAEAVARGAARCASHTLNRGAQAGAQTVSCGDRRRTLGR